MSDLQRVAHGERCRLGDLFWLVKCGQPVPKRAWHVAAAVAHKIEQYSPTLALASALGDVDLDKDDLDIGK